MSTLQGKVAIVTGAAGGIGRCIARALTDHGALVVVSDLATTNGEAFAAELGKQSIFIPCDISSAEQAQSLIDKTVERYGRLDIMVNNAGINGGPNDRVTADKYSIELWDRMVRVDLSGTFYCSRAAARQMVEQKSGNIINISSVGGVVALRLQIGFCAAKAGMIKMTEAMAGELGPFGIRVNAISPGSILTEGTRELFYGNPQVAEKLTSFIPQGRPGEGEEIADAVVFLASDRASYINGHNLVVDGGWTCCFNRDF